MPKADFVTTRDLEADGAVTYLSMSSVRAILVAIIAVSVAILPLAGASARVFAPADTHVATQSDCCPQGQDCPKPGSGDCHKSTSCALKCSTGFVAAMLMPSGLAPLRVTSEKSVLLSESPTSRSSNPPLPPPRV